MHPTKTILATAYAINPFKGSEDGMGWNFVCQIARFNKVIAITRENNRPQIERYMAEHPICLYENIQFCYFDLPYWMRFWKKGSRGALLYYWLWQKAIPNFIRAQQLQFDIVHNLNFHNDWTPSYLWKLGKPFVWGPIGHHPRIPSVYLKPYPFVYQIKESLTWAVKKYFWNMSSALRKTVQNADYICCMNQSVTTVLDLKPGRWGIMPSVATEDYGYLKTPSKDKFTVISAGRLVPLKGFDLTILAFAKLVAQLPDAVKHKAELLIVGSGPELAFYRQLAEQQQITPYIRFIEWIDRQDLMEMFKNASVFLFPSHEGAGMVVAEALSFGLPVVCLDNSGPGEFIDPSCGISVPTGDYKETVNGLADALLLLHQDENLYQNMRVAARTRFEQHFHWDRRGEQLETIYQNL
jgi:glycosyltransferase involved in cell wall biosynthesis